MKVLSKFASGKGLKLSVDFEVLSQEGLSESKIEELRASLRELGLDDTLGRKE